MCTCHVACVSMCVRVTLQVSLCVRVTLQVSLWVYVSRCRCLYVCTCHVAGTLISSFCSCCCGQPRSGSRLRAFGLNLVSALLQMLTFVVIVGWIWSIVWGMTFVQLSRESRYGHVVYLTCSKCTLKILDSK